MTIRRSAGWLGFHTDFHAASGDADTDSAAVQVAAAAAVVVALVGMQLVRAPARSATTMGSYARVGLPTAGRTVGCRGYSAAEAKYVQGKSVAVAQDVVLRTGFASIDRARTSKLAPLFARTASTVNRRSGSNPAPQPSQLDQDDLVQPIPNPGILPLPQSSPRGVSGPAAQVLRQVAPTATGAEHEATISDALRTNSTSNWPPRTTSPTPSFGSDPVCEPPPDPLSGCAGRLALAPAALWRLFGDRDVDRRSWLHLGAGLRRLTSHGVDRGVAGFLRLDR